MSKKLYSALVWGIAVAIAGNAYTAEEKPAAEQVPSAEKAPAAEKTEAGAPEAGQTKSKHWAYQPVKSPTPPSVKNQAWIKTPIDAFILAPLEAKQLTPSPEVDRAAFIRRATLDAWGVIPTPDEVQAFVNDKSKDAYEKLADRLLASPKYGERQARRWLDLARYADSSGFTNDENRDNMFRYRDYVVKAFNDDKPYTQFIQEQLAGDEIKPGDPEALIATGFVRSYPDDSNSRNLVQKKFQNTTDVTDTVGEVFLGQTVGCARCHNHKFDKISMKEYYQLQSFFANVNAVDNVPVPVKGEVEAEWEKANAKWEAAVKELKAKQQALIDPVKEKARKYNYERFSLDTQEALNKPEAKWTTADRWINHRYNSNESEEAAALAFYQDNSAKGAYSYDPSYAGKAEQFKALNKEFKKLEKLKPVKGSTFISAVSELGNPNPPPTHIHFAGEYDKLQEEVQPGFPAAITDEKPEIVPSAVSSGRRAALAKWIASPTNPLTARVFVNRVWGQYFGKGIVTTVSDFGKAGTKPTNPELLDYLADNFIKQGWSVKKLHREILLSNVYRQDSKPRVDVAKADPDNKLLAVFPRQRLDAEQIRDSYLVAAAKLEDSVGGPSVFPEVPNGLNAGDKWPVDKAPKDTNRRSLYVFTKRSVPYPMLDTFDMASAQQVHSKRDVTTTPLQSLALFNSDTVFGWSQALAGRVINEAGYDESQQFERLYQILFARSPSVEEKETLKNFLKDQEGVIKKKVTEGKFTASVPVGVKDTDKLDPVRSSAFVDLVHAVANSNEFVYRF